MLTSSLPEWILASDWLTAGHVTAILTSHWSMPLLWQLTGTIEWPSAWWIAVTIQSLLVTFQYPVTLMSLMANDGDNRSSLLVLLHKCLDNCHSSFSAHVVTESETKILWWPIKDVVTLHELTPEWQLSPHFPCFQKLRSVGRENTSCNNLLKLDSGKSSVPN